jgi:hypothetical protein
LHAVRPIETTKQIRKSVARSVDQPTGGKDRDDANENPTQPAAGRADRVRRQDRDAGTENGDEPHAAEFPPEGGRFHCHRHVRPHETHAEEGSDLDNAKEQQKQRVSQNAPSPHRAELAAKTIDE